MISSRFKEVIFLLLMNNTNFYDYLVKAPPEKMSPHCGAKRGEESLSYFLASQTLEEQIYNDTVFPTIISELRTLMTRWEETLHCTLLQ